MGLMQRYIGSFIPTLRIATFGGPSVDDLLFSFFSYEVVYKNLNRTSLGLGLPPSLEEPYEAEAPRTVLKPSLSSNGA